MKTITFLIILAVVSFSYAESNRIINSELSNRFIVSDVDNRRLDNSIRTAKKQRMQYRNIITVGNDMNCSHTSIQMALDEAPNGSQIRLSTADEFEENIIFPIQKNLALKGGYDNCIKAANDQGNGQKSIISGTGDQSVVRIQTSVAQSLFLENLHIKNGSGQNNGYLGGGISAFNANASVFLKNIDITDNEGIRGGGIYLYAGNPNLFLEDVNIRDNFAQNQGGGIYCSKLTSGGLIMDMGNLELNTSDLSGGGAYLNECFSAYLSTRISNNTSFKHGGGLALIDTDVHLYGFSYCIDGGASCLGNQNHPVKITRNSSNDSDQNIKGLGGGIYSLNTNIIGSGVRFYQNQAAFGGGIWLDSSKLLMTSPQSLNLSAKTCWNPGFCNKFEKNYSHSADVAGGGAIFFKKNSMALISHTHFKDNAAHFGSALAISGPGAAVKIETSLFTDHDAPTEPVPENNALIHIGESNPSLELAYVTITDNEIDQTVIQNDGGKIKVHSSIIYENNGVNVFTESEEAVDSEFYCIISHEIDSIGAWLNEVANPLFVNPQNQDYHLKPSSPAIDYCFIQDEPIFQDFDHEVRGHDWQDMNEKYGLYDLGVDEYQQ